MVIALILGLVAGLRTMTAAAAVSWAARLGVLPLGETWLAFLGYAWTPWVLSALALGEFVTDQLPSTPGRKVPVQFGARLVIGALGGAAIGVVSGLAVLGAVVGGLGAIIGTLAGAAARSWLAARFGHDLPATLIEDAVAVGGAVLIVLALR